jgi:NTE family protein
MYRLFFSLFISLFFVSAAAQEAVLPRKKVGVVLSGGGAKGFAHIGALKALEEAGIPIDYIAGTSMGSIVGALYAIGYDLHTIDSLVRVQDWGYLLSDEVRREYLSASQKENPDVFVFSLPYEVKIRERKGQVRLPPGVVRGQNLYSLFLNLTIGYQDEMDFDKLPIPFACVAADSRSGKEVVFREGILPEAIRASMAIPGLFAPVEKDTMLLIDGGIINNYPVDVVREMGADVVIGVKIPGDRKEGEKYRGTLSEVINQLWNFIGQEKRDKNIANTDILIIPDIHPYGMLDFASPAIDTIIHRGELAAREKWDELTALKERLHLTEPVKRELNPYIEMDSLEINSIRFEGLSKIDEKDLIKRIGLKNNRIAREDLTDITSRIYASGLFTQVYYRLDEQSPFDLVFTVQEKTLNTLDVGLRFDSRDMASILAHTSVRINSSLNSVFDVTARLSHNPYLKVNYTINNGPFYKSSIAGKTSRNEMDIYGRGKFAYKLDFFRNTLQFNFSEFYLYNIRLHLGASLDHMYYLTRPGRYEASKQDRGVNRNNDIYVNYFIRGIYDNLDRSQLPTSGLYFSFQYALHTDNLYQMYGKAPIYALEVNLLKPVMLSERLSVTPEVSARALFNASDSIPLVYGNFMGGQYNGHYVPQQIALRGSRGIELMKNATAMAAADIRYRFTPKLQAFIYLNSAVHHDDPLQLIRGKFFFGGSVGYTYGTLLGPLTLELGYSSLSRSPHAFACIGYYF